LKKNHLPQVLIYLMWLLVTFLPGSLGNAISCHAAESDPDRYRAWVRSDSHLDYPAHGCERQSYLLNIVLKTGGGVIPLSSNRFFIVWIPDTWWEQDQKRLVVALHGNGGCAERMFQFWKKMSLQHPFAVAALQYAEKDAAGTYRFDDAPEIYQHLRIVLGRINSIYSLTNVPIILHGFSRGSARVFELAILDRSAAGMKAFSAYIADSGTGFPEYQGKFSPMLKNVSSDAYASTRFWMYCGGRDNQGHTCLDMERMRHFVLTRGGSVDRFYLDPAGGHGIFLSGQVFRPGKALESLFDYIYRVGLEE
jgi:hypothetical protein